MEAKKPPTVLYVGGYRRSGSTLLGILLGKASGFVHVGEVAFLQTEFSSPQRAACACGQAPEGCEFWQAVLRTYRKYSRHDVTAEHMGRVQRAFEKRRGLVRLLLAWAIRSPDLQLYRHHVRALFRALATEASASVVVDSSKCTSPVAWRPILLAKRGGLDVRLIHLIRDGRGIMWSARKGSNRSLELGDASKGRAQLRAWSALTGWTLANAITGTQRKLISEEKTLLVRYEDLASDPERELLRIGDWLQADMSAIQEALKSDSTITSEHAVGGNRIRQRGISSIEPDLEWKRGLPRHDRVLYRLVSLLS